MDKAQLLAALEQAYRAKQLTELASLVEKAVAEYPNEAFGHYYKGEYFLSIGDADMAIPALSKAVEINPDSNYQLSLGLAKLQIGDDDAAKAIFEGLLAKNAKNAELHYALALYHLGKTDDDATLSELNLAIELNPTYTDALELRAYIHKNMQDEDEALGDLNKLLEINPDDVNWRMQRIEILKRMEDREGIEADFQYLIKKHPKDIEFRLGLGDYYTEIGEYQEAYYCYCDVIDIEKQAGISTAHPFKRRGAVLLSQGEYYKAIDDFKVVMKMDAEDPDAYLSLADAYYALHKPDMSLNYLEIGLDVVFDARWRLYQKRGELFIEQQKWDEAEDAFKGMTRDILGKAEGFFQLGLLYLRQGDIELAYKALKEADENLHDRADDLIQQHCQKFLKAEARLEEKELMAEYEEAIAQNAQSPVLKKAFGKLWKLDEKTTTDKNALLGQLPAEMRGKLLDAFKGMLVQITARGLLIFNLGQEDTRALYSIDSESGDTVAVQTLPFGRSVAQPMSFKVSDNSFTLCGIGSGKALLDLYFVPCAMSDLPSAVQKNYKEKEEAGNMAFL